MAYRSTAAKTTPQTPYEVRKGIRARRAKYIAEKREMVEKLQEIERETGKKKHILGPSIGKYIDELKARYGNKTPNEFFKGKTPAQIKKEAKFIRQTITRIGERIEELAKSGYEEIEKMHVLFGRKDAYEFLHGKNRRRKAIVPRAMHNVLRKIKIVKAEVKLVENYWKGVANKGKKPLWHWLNNEPIAREFNSILAHEMEFMRLGDDIIAKVYTSM